VSVEPDNVRFVVVVPFLNEGELLPGLLDSIAAQTRKPDRLVLVDDGSADDSAAICTAFAANNDYATLLRREKRSAEKDRLATASVFHAFTWALDREGGDWTVAVKLDADLFLPPGHFETVLRLLAENPRVGIAGAYLSMETGQGETVREPHPEHHVRGPNKFYRRACWDEIRPVPAILGWDTIDDVTARMRGWETRSIALPEGDPLHRRPTGTYDGAVRGFMRWGHCAYAAGSPPVAILAGGILRMPRRPRIVGGAAFVLGWCRAALRRVPRASPEVRAFYRAEQHARLRGAVRRLPLAGSFADGSG
jgi:poly-beta-1,6-N-acetyl-D-glucosamine synthase